MALKCTWPKQYKNVYLLGLKVVIVSLLQTLNRQRCWMKASRDSQWLKLVKPAPDFCCCTWDRNVFFHLNIPLKSLSPKILQVEVGHTVPKSSHIHLSHLNICSWNVGLQWSVCDSSWCLQKHSLWRQICRFSNCVAHCFFFFLPQIF